MLKLEQLGTLLSILKERFENGNGIANGSFSSIGFAQHGQGPTINGNVLGRH